MKYFFIISWLPITLNHEVGELFMRMKYVLCMVLLITGLSGWLALPALAAEQTSVVVPGPICCPSFRPPMPIIICTISHTVFSDRRGKS